MSLSGRIKRDGVKRLEGIIDARARNGRPYRKLPGRVFPGKGLELKGRQGMFAGVGRFDLWFEDPFKTNILMELKAVPAKYESCFSTCEV
jgi:hypothetical protein